MLYLILIMHAVAAATIVQTPRLPGTLPRIPPQEALAAIVKMIEPVAPAGTAGSSGGEVDCDVIIATDGTVESATTLAGAETLRPAAIAAVRQWRFKPFVVDGRPARVVALIALHFPDPAADGYLAFERAIA